MFERNIHTKVNTIKLRTDNGHISETARKQDGKKKERKIGMEKYSSQVMCISF